MPTEMRTITIVCYGKPQPQGSSRAFMPKGWTRPVITSANKGLKSFRQELSSAALEARAKIGADDIIFGKHEAVEVTFAFFFQRPPSAPKSRVFPTTKPDADKLCRSVNDSLTGIIFHDDSQVVKMSAHKFYGSPERVELTVREYKL